MTAFFVQIKCDLGKAYSVATAIVDSEIASEVYSTAGDYDLLVKIYLDASLPERARRRWAEVIISDPDVSLADVEADLRRRDHGKVGVAPKEAGNLLIILLMQDGAGDIDQGTPGPNETLPIRKDCLLLAGAEG